MTGIKRRSLLKGMMSCLAAPAIIKFDKLMPMRSTSFFLKQGWYTPFRTLGGSYVLSPWEIDGDQVLMPQYLGNIVPYSKNGLTNIADADSTYCVRDRFVARDAYGDGRIIGIMSATSYLAPQMDFERGKPLDNDITHDWRT